jgi:hypothetical protein
VQTNKVLDEPFSIEVAKKINSQAQTTFENTYRAALVTDGAVYVQGFLASSGKPYGPIEHSWLEVDDRIVDPTLPHLPYNAENLHYFPAQRLTVKQLKAAVEEAKEDYPEDNPLPIYGDAPYKYYGEVMLGGKDYMESHQAAEEKCQELNQDIADRN